MTDFNFLFDLERQLHSFETRSNEQKIASLLGQNFFEFGSSGKIWSRKDILERLPTEDQNIQIESSDYRASQLSDEVVLITYVSKRVSTDVPVMEFLRSSLWRKNSSGWQMEFHQGTPKA
jgi:hypothetical protein